MRSPGRSLEGCGRSLGQPSNHLDRPSNHLDRPDTGIDRFYRESLSRIDPVPVLFFHVFTTDSFPQTEHWGNRRVSCAVNNQLVNWDERSPLVVGTDRGGRIGGPAVAGAEGRRERSRRAPGPAPRRALSGPARRALSGTPPGRTAPSRFLDPVQICTPGRPNPHQLICRDGLGIRVNLFAGPGPADGPGEKTPTRSRGG